MPEPPPEFLRAVEAARIELERELAKLSPDELRQTIDAMAEAMARAIERDSVPREYEKDLLRRLGCHWDLDDLREFWLSRWAAARRAGISDAEFWRLTPRELCAVLELKATEFERLAGATASILRPETGGDTAPKAVETAAARPQPATIRNSKAQGRKRGPKPDHEGAARVAEIVARVVPDGDWRSKLDDVCEALDEAQIPYPKTWSRRDPPLHSWADAATLESGLAVKDIGYRLERAAKRKKTIPETLS